MKGKYINSSQEFMERQRTALSGTATATGLVVYAAIAGVLFVAYLALKSSNKKKKGK